MALQRIRADIFSLSPLDRFSTASLDSLGSHVLTILEAFTTLVFLSKTAADF